jgi:hypothetical protein
MFHENALALRIGAEEKNLGIIIDVSSNCFSMMGIKNQMILYRKIENIMPRCVAMYHRGFMNDYKEIGKSVMLGNVMHFYIRHAKQYVFPGEIYTKIAPSLEYGLTYLALIRKTLDLNVATILTFSDGKVDSMTDGLMDELCLKRKKLIRGILFFNSFMHSRELGCFLKNFS